MKGGAADSEGSLRAGDQILKVNDTDLKESTQEEAAAILKVGTNQLHHPQVTKRLQNVTKRLQLEDQICPRFLSTC